MIEAIADSPRDTVYISYNREMTEGFIRDCETWAKALNAETIVQGIGPILDEAQDILGYRIRFSNGSQIKALSSKPNNIRGKQARVIIDEAAFCNDLPKLITASVALLMWGGSLSILSTHNGIDNPFAELLDEIRLQDKPDWSLHRTNINDALADGLYRRIALVQGITWSPDQEKEWLDALLRKYGSGADEELLCIPYQAKAGKVFKSDAIAIADEIPPGTTVRFWDLAATEKTQKGPDPCYTAGVKMRLHKGFVYIIDVIAVQESAGAIDELMRITAIADGPDCLIRWELEGGSAGKRDAAAIARNLQGFNASPVRPQGDKVTRAKPLASQVNAGNCLFKRNSAWNKNMRKWLYAFPDGRIKDPIDAASGAYSVLVALQTPAAPQPSSTYSTW